MKSRLSTLAFGILGASISVGGACAQATTGPTPSQLMAEGYNVVAASSNGQIQYIYLQGADKAGTKKIYACQLLFSTTGGFQGCLTLP
jgi:hypothetical protein